MLVEPGVPKGTPAVVMMRWPGFASSSWKEIWQARSTMSFSSRASSETTQCRPQASDRRRAVDSTGEMTMTGTDGRSREARRPVAPEVV